MKKRALICLISIIAFIAALVLLLCPLPKRINTELGGFGTATGSQVSVKLDGTVYRYLIRQPR